jgi:hypothetical protein
MRDVMQGRYDECLPTTSSMRMIRREDAVYFERLQDEGPAPLEFMDSARLPNDFERLICHCAVQKWVERNPEYQPVKGWLFGLANNLQNMAYHCHSVVRKPDQSLLDDVVVRS